MDKIYEGSSYDLELSFTDQDDDPVTPATIKYTVYDRDSETELKVWTTVDVTSYEEDDDGNYVYTITIPDTVNEMTDSSNTKETRIVTIKSTYSDSKVLTDEYLYKIVNLPGIPEEA